MTKLMRGLAVLMFLSACSSVANVNADSSVNALNNQRVVAIGDIHGDYDQFVKLLRLTNLVDKRNRWIGGDAHLVQLGDIPDRGPDSRKAMDLLMKLEKAAKKKGGAVTVLIGNHEAMMMTNDLRFVHPGEYAAFKDKNSKARQHAYYQKTVQHLKNTLEEDKLPIFDKAHRKKWNEEFPLGYVEHRLAWSPSGKYGKWVLSHPVVAKVGRSLFVHGGISQEYSKLSLSEINTRARTELIDPASLNDNSLIEAQSGPLWHRAWARGPQTAENFANLDAVLQAYDVDRMVVAHTPTLPIVLPRFDAKVLMVDVGISAHYGNGLAALEIVGDKVTSIIGEEKLDVVASQEGVKEYFEQARALIGETKIQGYLDRDAQRLDEAQKESESSPMKTEIIK